MGEKFSQLPALSTVLSPGTQDLVNPPQTAVAYQGQSYKTSIYSQTDQLNVSVPDGSVYPITDVLNYEDFTIATNSFSVGNVVTKSSGTYALAQADTFANSKNCALITSTKANSDSTYTYRATYAGTVTIPITSLGAFTFAAGQLYYLSDLTAGGIMNTVPTGIQINKPVFFVLSSPSTSTTTPTTTRIFIFSEEPKIETPYRDFVQASPTFQIGEAVTLTNGIYALALADNTIDASSIGIITKADPGKVDINNNPTPTYRVTFGGIAPVVGNDLQGNPGIYDSLSQGSVYYLSQTVPGTGQPVDQSTLNVVQSLFIAVDSTNAIILGSAPSAGMNLSDYYSKEYLDFYLAGNVPPVIITTPVTGATFVAGSGANLMMVEIWGAGGQGGEGGNSRDGGGGGGGGYCRRFVPIQGGEQFSYTIGANTPAVGGADAGMSTFSFQGGNLIAFADGGGGGANSAQNAGLGGLASVSIDTLGTLANGSGIVADISSVSTGALAHNKPPLSTPLFFCDQTANQIKMWVNGVVTVLAGDGISGYANGAGAAARFNGPQGIAIDSSGNLYIADTGNNSIRKIAYNRSSRVVTVSTLAGGTQTSPPSAGSTDGAAIGTAKFNAPTALATNADGSIVYVADSNNNSVRVIKAGAVTTLATGFNSPRGIAVDYNSNLYVADTGNNKIFTAAVAGLTVGATMRLLAGDSGGASGSTDGTGNLSSPPGKFYAPKGICVTNGFNALRGQCLYIADSSNNKIRYVKISDTTSSAIGTAGVTVGTLAGNGTASYFDGDGLNQATFSAPLGIAVDLNKNIYVTDPGNNAIRCSVEVGLGGGINLVPAGAVYLAGQYTLAVTAGTKYQWIPGYNDVSLVNGSNTYTAGCTFTAVGAAVTINGGSGLVTAAVDGTATLISGGGHDGHIGGAANGNGASDGGAYGDGGCNGTSTTIEWQNNSAGGSNNKGTVGSAPGNGGGAGTGNESGSPYGHGAAGGGAQLKITYLNLVDFGLPVPKAWVVISGTTSPQILDQFNVASVTYTHLDSSFSPAANDTFTIIFMAPVASNPAIFTSSGTTAQPQVLAVIPYADLNTGNTGVRGCVISVPTSGVVSVVNPLYQSYSSNYSVSVFGDLLNPPS